MGRGATGGERGGVGQQRGGVGIWATGREGKEGGKHIECLGAVE